MNIVAKHWILLSAAVYAGLPGRAGAGAPLFAAEEVILSGGKEIIANGYSVPSFVDWDGDGLEDLIVGEGGGGVVDGKIRVYINSGTPGDPAFNGFFYAQSSGVDLVRTGGG